MPKPTPAPEAVYDELIGRPVLGLVYLPFVFLPLVFWPQAPASAWWASLAAALVFVPGFFAFRRWRGRAQLALVATTALLGLALITIQPGGNTFVIYACAMATAVLPARIALLATVAMVAAMTLAFVQTLPAQMALAYSLMAAVICALVVAGVLMTRARQRRDAELRLTQAEVARLAAMAERERIGRDLHDLLGHTLSLVALKSELAGRLVEVDPAAARVQIGEVESVARQALAQVREAVVGIRATGLEAELAAARLALLSADVHLDQRLAPVALDPAVESALAMALREAVTNVLRHAEARRVEVELVAEGDQLRLHIIDDGRGGADVPGNGLAGMRERLASFGGALDVDSPRGAGTRLQITLPRRALAVGP
ncbi:MAG TPA: sensor histidine kinase [Arenimonas sp.]|uniref:sensor histidine kinase n=1 Tax=Arenimonas sp. TaxID=1872635 RepID=UPI002D7FD0FC|nr:sensor histidine kinase [Arenimonas sp.]HEU0154084.1 sensor histidine kinase [Arenimonas sp.]